VYNLHLADLAQSGATCVGQLAGRPLLNLRCLLLTLRVAVSICHCLKGKPLVFGDFDGLFFWETHGNTHIMCLNVFEAK
jgi:hypothetical protein